jgi:hypothetical protein
MCYYGCTMLARILWGLVLLEPGRDALKKKAGLSVITALRRLVAIGFQDAFLTAVLILLAIVAGSLSYLLGFHLYLLCSGMTTNEYYKWKVVAKERRLRRKFDMKDEESGKTTQSNNESMPKNIYNLGVYQNVNEVLFPRSLRKQKSARHVQ